MSYLNKRYQFVRVRIRDLSYLVAQLYKGACSRTLWSHKKSKPDYNLKHPHPFTMLLNHINKSQRAALVFAGVVGGSFFAIRSFAYRPAQKQSPTDLLVPVERSGGGL